MRSSAKFARSFLAAGLALALSAVGAGAQDKAEIQAVSATNAAFDKAVSAKDIGAIDKIWAHEPYAIKTDPGARALNLGWDEIRKSWQEVLDQYKVLSVSTREPQIHVAQNVAWLVGVQTVAGTLKNGNKVTLVSFTTEIYEKRNGQWLMVAHINSRVPAH
jgi:ketosteroid isomerase-like protein